MVPPRAPSSTLTSRASRLGLRASESPFGRGRALHLRRLGDGAAQDSFGRGLAPQLGREKGSSVARGANLCKERQSFAGGP